MKKALLANGCVVILLLIFAISPMIPVAIAGSTAERYGCQLDEGSIHPCQAFGRDIGPTLYTIDLLQK